jgi:hypothetical protein
MTLGRWDAEQLVDYRLGQAHCREWLDGLSDTARSNLRADALRAVIPFCSPTGRGSCGSWP